MEEELRQVKSLSSWQPCSEHGFPPSANKQTKPEGLKGSGNLNEATSLDVWLHTSQASRMCLKVGLGAQIVGVTWRESDSVGQSRIPDDRGSFLPGWQNQVIFQFQSFSFIHKMCQEPLSRKSKLKVNSTGTILGDKTADSGASWDNIYSPLSLMAPAASPDY